MRRARDWICDCRAVNLGDKYTCFSCGEPKSANARAAARQVTDTADAGPPPCLAAESVIGLHCASAEAAANVEVTRPAAYYAAAAAQRGSFKPETFRTAALKVALNNLNTPSRCTHRKDRAADREARSSRQSFAAKGDHRSAIEQLKAEQRTAREAADSRRASERREREQRRAALHVQSENLADAQTSVTSCTLGCGEFRLDSNDGNEYTREEFIAFYGGTEEWESALPARSDA